jgi:hypothetical protein
MNKLIFIQIFVLFFLHVSKAQSIEIKGNVTNKFAKPIANANITCRSLVNNAIIQYSATNEEGNFNINFSTSESKILIKVSHVYYKTVIDTLVLKAKNKYNISLEESSISLKEVVLKNKKVKDTMKIKIDSLNLTEKSTLRDILSKTDGFNVSDEGGISFRGKQINKVLINKKEVFVNQNKIALDNLDYQIMNNLELINNYKDKFNLSFDSNVESVLNVNTKKEFKGVLKTSAEVGYGFVNSYQAKAKGMFFSDQLNTFLTNNTNTIGNKDFSFEDVSSAFKNKSSSFFKENFTPYFLEDELQKKAFDSNSSLTFRKEANKNKLGIVIYYNNLDFTKKNTNQVQKLNQEMVKEEVNEISNKGNSILTNLAFTHKINKNSLLLFLSDFAYSVLAKSGDNNVVNFFPLQNSSTEKNIFNTYSFLLNNDLSLKSRVNEKTILEVGIQNNLERSSQDFESVFFINNPLYVSQSFNFKNNYWKAYGEVGKKINEESYFSTTLKSSIGNEILSLKTNFDRQVINNEISIHYGCKKNNGLEMSITATPQMYHFLNNKVAKTNIVFNAKATASYKLSQNRILRLDYTQDNDYIDLYKNIDTLKLSFNNRLINEKPLTETISKFKEIGLGYYYSSLIKGRSFYINSTLKESTNHLQPILNSIVDNIFYYTNKLLDKKRDANVSVGVSKNYYLTKHYHLLRFSGSYYFNWGKIPTFINDEQKKYTTENQSVKSTISFEPKKIFFTEIAFSTTLNTQKLFLDDSKINSFNSTIYELGIIRKKDNFEFNISIGKRINKTSDFAFEIPILSVNSIFKITNKLNFFIKGKYLFHLLKTQNTENTNLNIVSDGNLIYIDSNQNNLNYLLLGLTYKF